MNETILLMMIQLITGAFATLMAILLWAKTRDTAWMLIIIAVVLWYGRILFQALEIFGVARLELSVPILNIIALAALENLPIVFISLGIIVMINRKS